MSSFVSGLIAVSLALTGTFAAALHHLPAHIAWFGVAMTLTAAALAIGLSLGQRQRPTTCGHHSELEQARRAIHTARAVHLERIRACADCPNCETVINAKEAE